MKNKILIYLTALVCVGLVSCKNETVMPGRELSEEELAGNYILFDENGDPYVLNADGTKDYINMDDDASETDSSEPEIEKLVGEYTGYGFTLNIMDGWFGVDTGDSVCFVPNDYENTKDSIQITTFENGGVEDYSDITKESLTEDFNAAVENGTYQNFEFIKSEEISIDGNKTLYYNCRVAFDDNEDFVISSYIVDDDNGGHMIVVSDQSDDNDMQDTLDTFLSTIKFTEE